jgi:hypothetical protein
MVEFYFIIDNSRLVSNAYFNTTAIISLDFVILNQNFALMTNTMNACFGIRNDFA